MITFLLINVFLEKKSNYTPPTNKAKKDVCVNLMENEIDGTFLLKTKKRYQYTTLIKELNKKYFNNIVKDLLRKDKRIFIFITRSRNYLRN